MSHIKEIKTKAETEINNYIKSSLKKHLSSDIEVRITHIDNRDSVVSFTLHKTSNNTRSITQARSFDYFDMLESGDANAIKSTKGIEFFSQ